MFRFNFTVPDEDGVVPELEQNAEEDAVVPQIRECQELHMEIGESKRAEFESANVFVKGPSLSGKELFYVSNEGLKIVSSEFLRLDQTSSDLIPGTYEGGYKVSDLQILKSEIPSRI